MADEEHARRALQWSLGRLTVSSLTSCDTLLQKFHTFLATATPLERQQLGLPYATTPAAPLDDLSQLFSAPLADTAGPVRWQRDRDVDSLESDDTALLPSAAAADLEWLTAYASAASTSPPPSALCHANSILYPQLCPGPEDYHAQITSKAQAFFGTRLQQRAKHTKYLVRAVQGFIEKITIGPHFAEQVWQTQPDFFARSGGSGRVGRLRRLYDGHCRIKRSREENSCADRLCYILEDHDLRQLEQSDELQLSQGRGRKTAALCQQAKSISGTVDAIRSNRKAGRQYCHLLTDGGPGFLLLVGSRVSTLWERKLCRLDILLILEFLETEVPEVYQNCKALDEVAARTLLHGFLAYGWTARELSATRSDLIDQLMSCIRIDNFQPGNASLYDGGPANHIGDGQLSKTSSEDPENRAIGTEKHSTLDAFLSVEAFPVDQSPDSITIATSANSTSNRENAWDMDVEMSECCDSTPSSCASEEFERWCEADPQKFMRQIFEAEHQLDSLTAPSLSIRGAVGSNIELRGTSPAKPTQSITDVFGYTSSLIDSSSLPLDIPCSMSSSNARDSNSRNDIEVSVPFDEDLDVALPHNQQSWLTEQELLSNRIYNDWHGEISSVETDKEWCSAALEGEPFWGEQVNSNPLGSDYIY